MEGGRGKEREGGRENKRGERGHVHCRASEGPVKMTLFEKFLENVIHCTCDKCTQNIV